MTSRNLLKEAKLWLVAIPTFLWTMIPIYHIFLFSLSTKESAISVKLWPDHPPPHNFSTGFNQVHFYLLHCWTQTWTSYGFALSVVGASPAISSGPVSVPAAHPRAPHSARGRTRPLPRLPRFPLGDPHGDGADLRPAACGDLLRFPPLHGRRLNRGSSQKLMAFVSFSEIKKSFGKTPVLHGISLDIADGEFMVLVGPSGCGKSTLLRMLAGLEEISAGEIAIDERVVNDVESKDRDVAMGFQSYALYPHMTVPDTMCASLTLRNEKKKLIEDRVAGAARILNLQDYLHRYPRELSGGQRQRVAMGRAIVRDPKVFLFDEPLSNLDSKLRVAMRAEIKALHQRLKTTTVYVTHDQVEAMTMAD